LTPPGDASCLFGDAPAAEAVGASSASPPAVTAHASARANLFI
jgi:hypothetical protein